SGLARFVVIKRALSQYSDNKEFRDMFKNEGKVACNLKHRSIAPMYDFGIENHQFYLAMEYISGRNLREVSRKVQSLKKAIDLQYVVYIIKEIASGLSYAHNAIESNTGQPLNLIHRDVSPQNIMLSFDGEIRVIDFGISKISNTDLTRPGHLKGKFSYMSPEQARGEVVDNQTDVFCLGIILWELLSNQRLFSAKNEMDALQKIKTCKIPDLKKINPSIPNELVEIVNKTLQKNKNLRTKKASILEKELNIFLNKNYPEFSQYDFMSFIKGVYSKEILEEREKLTLFSKDLKQHLKENDLSNFSEPNEIMNNLNLPSLEDDNFGKDITHTKTKSQIEEEPTQVSISESQSATRTEKFAQTADFKQENTVVPKQKVSSSNRNKKQPDASSLELIDNKEYFSSYSNPNKTKNKFKTNTNTYSRNAQLDNEKNVDTIKNVVGFGLAMLILFGGFYIFKNKENIASSKVFDQMIQKKAVPNKENLKNSITVESEEPKRTVSNFSKKILIQSNPSGAIIYANNRIIGTSPTLIKINLNAVSELKIKKNGYHSYTISKNQIQKINNSISVSLQKDLGQVRPQTITIIK
ncbi:MAG: protein kinase domain-containing protein, partial [Bdellovibrionales bacterium]